MEKWGARQAIRLFHTAIFLTRNSIVWQAKGLPAETNIGKKHKIATDCIFLLQKLALTQKP
ncbi:hypothetical protein D3H65_29540 [Paraflavitalea soli]|uniref:Uncharacterized protein n=1 Tax=Paraflavitalea soli TaxID=2315862 RepID=A0A3B7N7E9_9BACT|nr:hypothetical protein D3H65_29540 [Paraflavitalea soli]